jgi:hypothetical protein
VRRILLVAARHHLGFQLLRQIERWVMPDGGDVIQLSSLDSMITGLRYNTIIVEQLDEGASALEVSRRRDFINENLRCRLLPGGELIEVTRDPT